MPVQAHNRFHRRLRDEQAAPSGLLPAHLRPLHDDLQGRKFRSNLPLLVIYGPILSGLLVIASR